MGRAPNRPGNLLLIVSIVGAILGMEIDVISGPLVPDSFSLILCELYTPSPDDQESSQESDLRALPAGMQPGRSVAEDADGLGETSSQLGELGWPATLIVGTARPRDGCPSYATATAANTGILESSLARNFASARPRPCRPNLPLQLCRLLC